MSEKRNTFIAIQPANYQGHQLFGELWSELIDSLRDLLRKNGFEDSGSTPDFLLFSFSHPYSAILALLGSLEELKANFKSSVKGPIPLRIIIHQAKAAEIQSPFLTPEADFWDMLEFQAIFISRPLKNSWDQFMANKNLPKAVFKNEGNGLFKLQFSSAPQLRAETIFPYRSLPLQGSFKECFYCGMKSHPPSECPSKYLTMEMNGLAVAGYLPFDQFNSTFKKVFTKQDGVIAKLRDGIKAQELRKNSALAVYTAYMDVCLIYQIRFLWHCTFSVFAKWDALFKHEKTEIDAPNLQLGIDCLRVGEYGKAKTLLTREADPKMPKRFFATIGLAFLSLEQGRTADMANHLETANHIAVHEKERIYAGLLLSRFYDLVGEEWKARDTIKNLLGFNPKCQESIYRSVQLEVKGRFTADAFQKLRSMMLDQREIFMAILMDPALIAIQDKVEDVLSNQYDTLEQQAHGELLKADREFEDLKQWFGETDEQMQANLKIMDSLKTQYERKSYCDVYDVASRAKNLLTTGKQMRNSKQDELFNMAQKTMNRWSAYSNFWRSFAYQSMFPGFYGPLPGIKKKLTKIQNLVKKNRGKTYREATALLKDVRSDLSRLEPTYKKMMMIKAVLDGSVIFTKKLIMVECGLLALVGALLGIGAVGGESIPLFGELSADATLRNKTFMFAGLLLAPISAMAWTFLGLDKKN